MPLATLGSLIDGLTQDGAIWFSAPAIAGTLYFLISLAMGQLGGDLDLDMDGDVDVSTDDPGGEFRVLSLQTLSAFGMGSGWMGLAAYRLTDMGFSGASIVAVITGVGVAWLLVVVLRMLFRLQSSGNISIRDTHGLEGDVYIAVPPAGAGSGRVTVVMNKRRREYDAVQAESEPIATHTRVRVVGVDAATNTLTIERA